MAAMMTIASLVELESERATADRVARDATARRNEAVLTLLDSGVRQAAIARALDVTPGRVSQIVATAQRHRAAA